MSATTTESTNLEQQLVAFRLATELYGVGIGQIQEIIRLQEITPLPRSEADMAGVINLRGKIVPVLDLRKRLNLPEADPTRATRIIVVAHGDGCVGLIVDDVTGVLRLPKDTVEPADRMAGGLEAEALLGVGKSGENLVLLLDLEHVLRGKSATLEEAA